MESRCTPPARRWRGWSVNPTPSACPKIDRIACPWLIRRFVDPMARFLFVTPSEVATVAEQLGGAPFDVEGNFWGHRGDGCTFDTMLDEFGLRTPALDRLATIVRAADTDRLNMAPQAAGLLARVARPVPYVPQRPGAVRCRDAVI